MRGFLCVLSLVALSTPVFAVSAEYQEYKGTSVTTTRVAINIYRVYSTTFTMVQQGTLGEIEGTCHGCSGACMGHYQKISREFIMRQVESTLSGFAVKAGGSRSRGTNVEATIEEAKIGVTQEDEIHGEGEYSSQSSNKKSEETKSVRDIELGTKSHAPKCWKWFVKCRADMTIRQCYVEKRTSVCIAFGIVELYSYTEYDAQGPPILNIKVVDKTTDEMCCCDSRLHPDKYSGSAKATPTPSPTPPGPRPQATPRGKSQNPKTSASSYLRQYDDEKISKLKPVLKDAVLDQIDEEAKKQGVNLGDSLGKNWRGRFLDGEFRQQSPNTAMYAGKKGGVDRFVVPSRIPSTATITVTGPDGPVPDENVETTPAKDGSAFTLVSVKSDPAPKGATVIVTAPDGTEYEGKTPPEKTTVLTSTTIRRGPNTTTIKVTPQVEATDGEGKTEVRKPDSPSEGAKTSYRAKDDSGFWDTLLEGASLAAGVLVPLGSSYLLQPSGDAGSAVRTTPDGSMEIEVPNETYDQALAQAQANDPNFTSESVASSLQGGLTEPVETGGLGIKILSVSVLGGSKDSLRPGDEVIFTVSVDGERAAGFSGAQVDICTDGLYCGGLIVQEAYADPATGQGAVTAIVPAGLQSASGELHAHVRSGSGVSDAAILHLAPNEVEVVAMQKVVMSGNMVQVILRSPCQGCIKGVLSISGPGTFVGGGTTMRFDAWSTAEALVVTQNPGAITVTFSPDDSASTSLMEKFE